MCLVEAPTYTPSRVAAKRGEDVVLSPRPSSWDAYLAGGPVAPDDFMVGVEDLPVQERA